uniref:Uncharacterized protein n=1 Tax=Lutzomyia longipalpis TaxID=7200 RepID=A0A1B0CLM0_LUTLO
MSEELRALIDSTLEEDELVLWRKITAVDDGELTEEINMQKRFLADHNPFQANNNVPSRIKKKMRQMKRRRRRKKTDENAKNGDNSHTSEEATDVPLNAATESTNDGEIGNSAEEPKSNENSADEILPSNGPSDSIDVELKNCNNNEINDCKSQPTSNKTAIVATAVDENNATSFVENGPA